MNWFKHLSLKWAVLTPVLLVMLIFALVVGAMLCQRLSEQARADGIASAQARLDTAYMLLRGRFEYQLTASQGVQQRYEELTPVVQEESLLILKNLLSDWQGTLAIQDSQQGWLWLWDGHTWQHSLTKHLIAGDDWMVSRSFLPWAWQISVRPPVELIEKRTWVSQLLLMSLIAGLWLLSAWLVRVQLRRLVIEPMTSVNQFLSMLGADRQQHIDINGSRDMSLLSEQLNQLSQRLFIQQQALQSQMVSIEEDRRYVRAILDTQPAMTILTDGERITMANAALFRFFDQYASLEAFVQDHGCICDFFKPYQDPLGYAYFSPNHPQWVDLAATQDYRVLIERDGHDHHFMVRTDSFDHQQGKIYVAVLEDITGHVQAELAMREQLITDMNTQLPNRMKLLSDMMLTSPQGVLLIKVLEFGRLNEVYGIEFGDAYLKAFAQRLQEEHRQVSGLIGPYRLSGSEFAYQLFDDSSDVAHWQESAKWLLNDLNQRDLSVWGADIPVMVTAGLSLWDSAVDDAEQLLLQASMAMHRAKDQHLSVLVYDDAWRERQRYQEAQEWLEKVRQAIADDRVEPVFQPIYNQKTQQIDKYECLIRLRDQSGQLIAPGLFLDAVRHTREYLQLTEIMFQKSCAIFAERSDDFSLNLSEDDFRHEDHLARLAEIVSQHQVGSRLVIEILESEEITSYEQLLVALEGFKALGCQIAIDDFGSGYSNFAHINGLQPNYLKIDGSLIQAMLSDVRREAVVEGIIQFAHRMQLKVIAEFVSCESLLARLTEMGVDAIQGYVISPPVQAAQLQESN